MSAFYPAWLDTVVPENQAPLDLDGQSIKPEDLSMGTLTRELNLRRRPAWILRKLMSALESKRIEKRLGWSRPWNKKGMMVFRSHTVRCGKDTEFLGMAAAALSAARGGLPEPYRDFAAELLADPALMAFVFYHNRSDGSEEYEGFTLSLGRRFPEDKTKRDRLDIVLEDRRSGGRVDGTVDRARIFTNPWLRYREGDHQETDMPLAGGDQDPFQSLYRAGVAGYLAWKDDPERQWEHWSARYIDYFGSRSFIPLGSSFT